MITGAGSCQVRYAEIVGFRALLNMGNGLFNTTWKSSQQCLLPVLSPTPLFLSARAPALAPPPGVLRPIEDSALPAAATGLITEEEHRIAARS